MSGQSNLKFITLREAQQLPNAVIAKINGIHPTEVAFAFIYLRTESKPVYFDDPLHLRRGHGEPRLGTIYVAEHIVFTDEEQYEFFKKNVDCRTTRVSNE